MNEIRLESVSIGKGFVRWRVVTPHLRKRPRDLEEDYEDLTSACEVVPQLTVGMLHSCLLNGDRSVVCWGSAAGVQPSGEAKMPPWT